MLLKKKQIIKNFKIFKKNLFLEFLASIFLYSNLNIKHKFKKLILINDIFSS